LSISHGPLFHQHGLCLSNKSKCQVRALSDFPHRLDTLCVGKRLIPSSIQLISSALHFPTCIIFHPLSCTVLLTNSKCRPRVLFYFQHCSECLSIYRLSYLFLIPMMKHLMQRACTLCTLFTFHNSVWLNAFRCALNLLFPLSPATYPPAYLCFIRNSALSALLPQLLPHKWNCHLVPY
uniref:Uncharacterized protein n=1 Tax=Echinococcus canadensis TaxID=519352 RepID=A0A915EYW0_9CEST